MSRDSHQPHFNPVERPERSPEQMQAVCGRTISIVMAYGANPNRGIEGIATAIATARRAQLAGVFVLAGPEHVDAALEAVRTCGRKGRTLVQAIEYDPAAGIELTRGAGDFELFNLPFGLLETARVIADSVLDTYESVLIMDAAQTSVTADHLYEICLDAQERDVDVVAPWIQKLRRPPVLATRAFLESLADADFTQPVGSEGTRAIPHINTFDHLFGEEQLAAVAPIPPAVESFLDRCTLSALEAVRLAQDRRANSRQLNNADALLVKTASEVIAAGDALAASEADKLAWADAFGHRNKQDFPLLNDQAHAGKLVYLDSAATSQRVASALEAQRQFDEHENANVYRGAYELSAQATLSFRDARMRLAEFIGADWRQVVYTANTTDATNLVALAWGEHNIGEGDLIVCCLADHHSNMLPFLMLAQRKGARVEYAPFDANGRLDRNAFGTLLEQHPKLVCLTHVGNTLGIEAPVKELAAAAHAAGARVLVDAAQSFPHLKVDVAGLGVDWLAVSAHKAYGPMGIGALYIAPEAFAEMDPLGGGGGTVSHVAEQSYYLRPFAPQYEMGTPPVSQAIGWAAAVEYLEGLGMEHVAQHSAALTRYAARGLQRIDGVNVLGDHTQADGQTGLVSFTVRSVAPAETAQFLGRLGVAIRSGGHCALPLHARLGMIGSGRLSIAVHTTREDIDAALTAIALCRQAYEA